MTIDPANNASHKSIFYECVHSTMIRHAIEGHFSQKTLMAIKLQSHHYEWRDPTTGEIKEDGATMIKVLFDIIKPATKVGLTEYKEIIKHAHGKDHHQNVTEILDSMEKAYNEITYNHRSTYDDYMDDLFTALKSFQNKTFTDYVVRLEIEYQADNGDIDEDTLIQKCQTIYNNIKTQKTWKLLILLMPKSYL